MTGQQDHIRLSDPGDVLETVPYLLGFRPRQSLVLLGLYEEQVRVTVRLDLADVLNEGADVVDQRAEVLHLDALRHTVAVLRRAEVSAVVAVVYDDQPERGPSRSGAPLDPADPLPWQGAMDDLFTALLAAGMALLDAFLVVDDWWWSYGGRAGGCPCCAVGEPLPGDSSPAAASAVFAGMTVLADREAMAATLSPRPDCERLALLPALFEQEDAVVQATLDGRARRWQLSAKRALFAAAREADDTLIPRTSLAVGSRSPAGGDPLSRFAVALADVAVRDSLWLAIDQRRLDGRALWRDMLQRLPAPYDTAALFLFGWASWRDGNGALAAMAAERALASDSRYSAADLLLQAVRNGMDPFRTPRLRTR